MRLSENIFGKKSNTSRATGLRAAVRMPHDEMGGLKREEARITQPHEFTSETPVETPNEISWQSGLDGYFQAKGRFS